MADVYNYVNDTGVILTDATTINEEVVTEYKNAFGTDLNTDPSTPQGLLITIETLSRIAVADNNAGIANQINPNIAGGVFLDALLALTGSFRVDSTQSSVFCTIMGVEGTFIPANSLISGAGGIPQFYLLANVTIPPGGTVANVQFNSVEDGPIDAAANTLTVRVSNILGWTSVTNPAAAILGTITQNDTQARLQRTNTLAAQGNSLAYNVISNLFLLEGVAPAGLTFQENVSSITQTINEIPMVSHSLYACVGGTSTDLKVATTLQNSKAAGCAYNNGFGIPISQVVEEPFSGQDITVLFDRPSIVTVNIEVTVHLFTSVQDVDQAVKNAIIAYSNGQLAGQSGFAVGQAVSPFQIAAAVSSQIPGLFVQEVSVGVVSITQQGLVTDTSMNITNLTYNAPVGGFQGIVNGMLVTDPLGYIPPGATVTGIIGQTTATLSVPAAGGTATEILTFLTSPIVPQTTEIPIGVWQKAFTSESIIAVTQV